MQREVLEWVFCEMVSLEGFEVEELGVVIAIWGFDEPESFEALAVGGREGEGGEVGVKLCGGIRGAGGEPAT